MAQSTSMRSVIPSAAASFSACARVIVFSGPSLRSLFQIVCVVLAFAPRAHGEDDEVEDRPPLPARHLDDALVGQELLQVAAHRPVVGAVGRAEVQQQHADAPAAHVGMAGRPVRGVGLKAAAGLDLVHDWRASRATGGCGAHLANMRPREAKSSSLPAPAVGRGCDATASRAARRALRRRRAALPVLGTGASPPARALSARRPPANRCRCSAAALRGLGE